MQNVSPRNHNPYHTIGCSLRFTFTLTLTITRALANTALAENNIRNEVDRYTSWPGQATAYKIGEIRLRAIRTRAEVELGGQFDIRRFHDALLVDGPLPMALLDARMDRWIAEEKARPAD